MDISIHATFRLFTETYTVLFLYVLWNFLYEAREGPTTTFPYQAVFCPTKFCLLFFYSYTFYYKMETFKIQERHDIASPAVVNLVLNSNKIT